MPACTNCKHELDFDLDFQHLGEIIDCPKCATRMTVEYEESYDSETEDEWRWFWLEEIQNDMTT